MIFFFIIIENPGFLVVIPILSVGEDGNNATTAITRNNNYYTALTTTVRN